MYKGSICNIPIRTLTLWVVYEKGSDDDYYSFLFFKYPRRTPGKSKDFDGINATQFCPYLLRHMGIDIRFEELKYHINNWRCLGSQVDRPFKIQLDIPSPEEEDNWLYIMSEL